jgi:hypothetical protein
VVFLWKRADVMVLSLNLSPAAPIWTAETPTYFGRFWALSSESFRSINQLFVPSNSDFDPHSSHLG